MITHNQSRIKSGFSLIEVIISSFIAVLLIVGIFRVNAFLAQNNTDIIRTTLLGNY